MRKNVFMRIVLFDFLMLLDKEQIVVISKNKKVTITEQTVERILTPYLTRIKDEEVFEALVKSVKIKGEKVYIALDKE